MPEAQRMAVGLIVEAWMLCWKVWLTPAAGGRLLAAQSLRQLRPARACVSDIAGCCSQWGCWLLLQQCDGDSAYLLLHHKPTRKEGGRWSDACKQAGC